MSLVNRGGLRGGDLAAAAGGNPGGPRSRALERVFAELDTPFREWLLSLHADVDEIAAQRAWHEQVYQVVQAAAGDLLRRVPPACWAGRKVRGKVLTAAHAHAWYWKNLRGALPYAFDDHDQPEPREHYLPRRVPVTDSPARPQPRTLGTVGQIVDKRVSDLQYRLLCQRRDPAAVTALARLRRGAGKPPGGLVDILGSTTHEVFSVDHAGEEPSRDEHAAHVAITLYALHQHSRSEGMHRRGQGLGTALRALHTGDPTKLPEPLTRRFRMLVTADSFAELSYHLCGAVALLRAKGIPLDYGLLADQLVTWQQPDGPAQVQLRWGRELYRTASPNQSAEAPPAA